MHAACYFTSLFGAYMQHVTLNKISRNVFYQEKEAVPMVYNTAGRKLATFFFISANINSAGFCNSIGEMMILLPLVTHVLLDWASGGMEGGKMAGVG